MNGHSAERAERENGPISMASFMQEVVPFEFSLEVSR